MKVTFFSTKPYDREFFDRFNPSFGFELEYYETHLGPHIVNAVEHATAICAFVNDKLNAEVIDVLARKGIKYIALRCAGFNNVDLEAARQAGLRVCRVPAYSPEAVAEHALAMILTLNRKTHKAYNRVREQNFSLKGLMGFNLHGKIIGIIGTGNIGRAFARLMRGFGCTLIAYDVVESDELKRFGVQYLPLREVFAQSDILSLHCPLLESTRHLINAETLRQMKKGVMIINTSRGGLIDSQAVLEGLRFKQIGYLGIDVYEQEDKLFFRDLSHTIIDDDTIQLLMSFPNVLVTGHQAFFTSEAMEEIALTTLKNLARLAQGLEPENPAAVVV
ncbi:2-hydroxyacid dehydrogenase [Parapedobacter sp. ISTM3]|uniref:D-lactate dehydrogenase n=1 Tax=Parapedobacter luteus TaxID=623280 RepID=A0A1T5ANF0_9SPHI|nr:MULTISPECIES: 2-hydroxyacid dehydrogenase [Parapedobacter]MBK1441898.1 2-hydroxyacid dehydrogenase [Parapedobacter sp. ISTM3]SKB36337.1 D-lactate dehydrogenase [Parapedobacter luteus]